MYHFTHPLNAQTFARLMQNVGPFETRPRIAVAVSGGPDSMALCGLMVSWMRDNGGETVALTVDHRLRKESSYEAKLVGERLSSLRVTHNILTWTGPQLKADVQAQARAIRYQLLEEWCGSAGILHLALAHHQDDQAETVLLRLARGSGLRGLAAMAPVVYRRHMRLVRPLLQVPRACLKATCSAYDLAWTDDPSNQNEAFARVRMRRLLPLLAQEGISTARLSATARSLTRAGLVINEAVANFLAKSADIHPFGFARITPSDLRAVSTEVALRALAFLFKIVGGRTYPPRLRQLEALYVAIVVQKTMQGGRTLAGCLVRPVRETLLLCREPAAVEKPIPISAGKCCRWDGRFLVHTPHTIPHGSKIGALGHAGWRAVTVDRPVFAHLSSDIGCTLPSLHTPNGDITPLLPVKHFCHENLFDTTAIFSPDTPALVRA